MAKEVKCLLSIRAHILFCNKVRFKSSHLTSVRMENNNYFNQGQHTYEDAIEQLNKLQSNAQVLSIARLDKGKTALASLPMTRKSLLGIGVQLEELDSLNIIHVAGSKGKGMTCAFTESILRHAGLKTGFFSSPHLVAVRERIRIDGQPLTQQQFTEYFFTTYNRLNSVTENKSDLPGYFRFLTCMAFYVFLKEKVDVAVMEVGIGGLNDSTNVIRKPVVVGITSLGLEHQFLLGNTLEEIAKNKAGIMKENVPAFTVNSHSPDILDVLKNCALSYNCPLFVAPAFQSYGFPIELGVDDGAVSRINASLAIQLSSCFLKRKFPEKQFCYNDVQKEMGVDTNLLQCHVSGLQHAKWHGRFQVLDFNDNLSYFLDGAHTADSLIAAKSWFLSKTNENSLRVLIFNLTGDRKSEDLIKPFASSGKFQLAVFCPMVVSKSYSSSAGSVDNWSALEADENLMQKCDKNKNLWLDSTNNLSKALVFPNVDSTLNFLEKLSLGELVKDKNDNQEAMDDLLAISRGKKVSVLVTGSLHLVGTFLSLLTPELK